MAGNNMSVDSRYLSYDKADVERILGSVEHLDGTPTPGSGNPVTSDAVARALEGKQDTMAVASDEEIRSIVWGDDTDDGPEPEE